MPRSAKQLAFFKRVVDEAGLCGSGADVFDLEILKNKHAARIARATKAARAMRDRLRSKRSKRKGDKWAQKHGFGSVDEMTEKNWIPYKTAAAWRKKVKSSQRKTKPTKTVSGYKKAGLNPFKRDEHVEYRG